VLQANGIDPAKVDLLKADPAALAPMLATGQVVATINWITVAPAFEKPLAETHKKLNVIQWSNYGFDGYGLSVFASDKMLTQKPETVKKFLRAYAKANAMAIADPKAPARNASAPRSCSRWSGFPTSPASRLTNCPAACSSASPSHGRCCSTPTYC
jgi:NitT/TauT family transport system substrate-binding protein